LPGSGDIGLGPGAGTRSCGGAELRHEASPAAPAEVVRFAPAARTFNGVPGELTGSQITLIAVRAVVVGVAGVLVDRAQVAGGRRDQLRTALARYTAAMVCHHRQDQIITAP